jgi:imidazolonepropionase-like amidohydrolase
MMRLLARLGVGLALSIAVLYLALRAPAALDPPEQRGLVLHDVTLVNPGVERTPHRQLRIEGGVIESIAPQGSGDGESSAGLDAAGLYALPGLMDMHVHHPPDWLPGEVELFDLLFLRHGVTSVRDAGSLDGSIFDVRRRIQTGKAVGPRIFGCGRILDGSAEVVLATRVANPAEGRAAVRDQAKRGADCIKVFNGLSEDTLEAIREEAARYDLALVGHVPFGISFRRAGLVDVQHLTGVVSPSRSNESSRFPMLIQEWGKLSQARIGEIVSISARQGIAHTPTLVMMQRLADLSNYEALREAPTSLLLPEHYREILWHPKRFPVVRDLSRSDLEDAATRVAQMQRVVGALHRSGVRIFTGTDTPNPFVVPGASLYDELRLLAEAGLTPEEVWVAATRSPGAFLAVPGLGTLAEGAPADIALFRDDPSRDLAALATLEAVVAQGRLYTREQLDRAIAIHTRHHGGRIYRSVVNAVAAALLPLAAEDPEGKEWP